MEDRDEVEDREVEERKGNVDTGEGKKLAKGLFRVTSLKFCERAATR